ncbi:hypothetical protein, partial [Metallosphaera hakonensis]|uniref:hypothetical protein n=1 Tax=Metallosphaera hakonensis TaxID=79601 RepID=UPI000A6BBA3C
EQVLSLYVKIALMMLDTGFHSFNIFGVPGSIQPLMVTSQGRLKFRDYRNIYVFYLNMTLFLLL